MADQQPVQLNMDVDQVNNLQQQLQEDIGQPPPQQENAGQGQGGPPQPNQVQQNQHQQNNFHFQQVEPVYPLGQNPRFDDVPAPRGNAFQQQRGQKVMNHCPKYARKRPWRQYVCEFHSWVECFSLYLVGDDFIKDAMVWSMRGQAMDMIHPHRSGSATYMNNVTWRAFARAIEHIFAPRAESQLAKQEFKTYKQGQTEDISSYLATKRALFDVAYTRNGPFDTLLDEVISGIINNEVKRELRMRNPQNADEMSMHAVQIVANVRAAYENGYGLSESKAGLYHTTMLGIRENQEEPIDVNAMRRKMRQMEEQINEMNTGVKCYNCNRMGHVAKDCKMPYRSRGGRGGAGRGGPGRGGKRGGGTPSGGRFPFPCHYCKKPGHKIADCFKKKKDEKDGKKSGGGRTQQMDQEDVEEGGVGQDGYHRFLDPAGEQELN